MVRTTEAADDESDIWTTANEADRRLLGDAVESNDDPIADDLAGSDE
jgi:hypothetical protein